MRSQVFVTCIVLLGLGCGSYPAHAQDSVMLRGPTCATCRIVVERVLRIGEDSGPRAFMQGAALALWNDDSFLLSSGYEPGTIHRFDFSGNHLASFGGRGEGPGEQRRVQRIRVVANTVYVLDALHGTINRYDAAGRFLGLT